MTPTDSAARQSTWQLIFVPAIISLGVTLFRLVGELAHWSPKYFDTEVGGGGAVVGSPGSRLSSGFTLR
jgi:hypothetical protein